MQNLFVLFNPVFEFFGNVVFVYIVNRKDTRITIYFSVTYLVLAQKRFLELNFLYKGLLVQLKLDFALLKKFLQEVKTKSIKTTLWQSIYRWSKALTPIFLIGLT
jgi:hypothetical protein